MSDPTSPPPEDASEGPAPRPWWTYAVPYFGKTPDLSRNQWRIMGLLVVAELFEHYDVGLLSMALVQIQAELGIAEEGVGSLMGVVRLGALPAIGVGVLADRWGRRNLLVVTIIGSAIFTFLSGLVQTPDQYQFVQFFARLFLYSEPLLASVVIVEELKARDRGFGIGMLGALGALGHGLGYAVFAGIDYMPHGWRDLYLLGSVPLLAVAWFRRSLPETRRFEAAEVRGKVERWWHPINSLFRQYPGRLAAITLAYAPIEFVETTAVMFSPKILQELHGYDPGDVASLAIVGGAVAILGNIYAGVLSDRIGRRLMMTVLVAGLGAGYWLLYNGGGFVVQVAWVGVTFCAMGLGVLFKTVGAELFPTSHRSAATMVRAALGIAMGSVGLFLESELYVRLGSHVAAISAILPALLIAPVVIWWVVPETSNRELEEIAPER
jgi:putative MFS transporter